MYYLFNLAIFAIIILNSSMLLCFHPSVTIFNLLFDMLILVIVQFRLKIIDTIIRIIQETFQLVFSFNYISLLLILFFVLFCFFDHPLDIFLTQPAFIISDLDLFHLATSFTLCLNIHDCIFIDIECNFDLWDSSFLWTQTSKIKPT